MHEWRNILAPFAQRRHLHRKDVKAVIQILPEFPAGDLGLKIAIGRRDHAHIHLKRETTADAFELIFLQHPQHQHGGVSRDQWGAWWGQWRETDDNGKRVMRNIRLGDYDLPTKERARLALDAYLKNENKLPEREPDTLPLGKKGVYRVIVQTARRAGLTGIHSHILRHSCATHCLNHGMDIRFVQEMLGHTSLMATQKYLHLTTANLKSVHTKFFPKG